MSSVERLLERLEGVKRNGSCWMARCPAHDDHTPSLSVREGSDSRVLIHCHAGCATDDVVAAAGLTLADLMPPAVANIVAVVGLAEVFENGVNPFLDTWTPCGPAVATYPYTDERCRLLYAVCRTADKQFPTWRPDPSRKRGRDWHVKGLVRPVLYHLPRLIAGVKASQTIYVVDGEKDVGAVEKTGGFATTWPHWAGGWRPEYSVFLTGADVVIVVDQDDGAGECQARDIARQLGVSL